MNWLQLTYLWLGRHKLHIGVGLFWIVLVLAVREYMLANGLSMQDVVRQLSNILVGEWYGPLLYILVYLLRPVLLFPASPLAILAGNLFGLGMGFVYGLIAGTLSATIPYLVGRWFTSGEIEEIPEDERSSIRRFVGMMQRNSFQSILLMRLLYLPYDTVNLGAGVLRLRYIPFLVATGLGNIAGTFAFVGIGASIEGDITTGEVSLNPWVFVLSITIFVISILVSRLLNARQSVTRVSNP